MPAGEPMAKLHDRQPVILDPSAYDAWLDPETVAAGLKPMLGRNLDGELQFHRVSRMVNNARTKDAGCIEPSNPL